jgi:hypothetical protein
LIHVAYMYFDIGKAIYHGSVQFLSSSKQGLLEYIKDTPRVGRRYVSIALLHLLWGGLLMAWHFRRPQWQRLAWSLVGMSILSMAILDARAAYASVLIGGFLTILAVGPMRAWQAVDKSMRLTSPGWKLALACLSMGVVAVGYNAGKSRWISMSYSVRTAVHDVSDTKTELALRPYIDAAYWNAPIKDIEACFREAHFRCKADQSAYLRVAWLLVGLSTLVHHPFGIGYSENYLGRVWGVAGDESKYQRSDNFLVEIMVTLGLPGLAIYGLLFYGVLRVLRRSFQSGNANQTLILVCGLIMTCAGRGIVDVFSEGLWRYLMALLGVYYGLVHAERLRVEEKTYA